MQHRMDMEILVGVLAGIVSNALSLVLVNLLRLLFARRGFRSFAEPPQLAWPRSGVVLVVGSCAVLLAFLFYLLAKWMMPSMAAASPLVPLLIAIGGSLLWPVLGRPMIWRGRSAWLNNFRTQSHIFFFSPNLTDEQLEYSHATIRDAVSSGRHVDILVGNGFRTLGDSRSLLRDVLEGHPGKIRVLMLDPCCDSARRRAAVQSRTHADYLNRSRQTLTFLETMRNRNPERFDYKLYTSMPIWRAVITDTHAFIQHLSNTPEPKETPLFGIQRGPHSWCDAFASDFDERFKWFAAQQAPDETRALLKDIRTSLRLTPAPAPG